MDTNNISSILEAIAKANEAVKQVPALEAEINDLMQKVENSADTIATLNDRINVQASTLTDRAETIARLEKELSEARFREQAAREANDRAITTLRDIVDFANVALPVPAKPEVVEEAIAHAVEMAQAVPLADTDTASSGEIAKSEPAPSMTIETGKDNTVYGYGDLNKIEPEPASKPHAGQPYADKPWWMSDSEWFALGGQEWTWKQHGYATKPSWWAAD